MTKTKDTALRVRDFLHVAADVLVRGQSRRLEPAPMKTKYTTEVRDGDTKLASFRFVEPEDDYLDWAFGECLTPGQATLWANTSQQLVNAFMDGDIPAYMPPLYARRTKPDAQALEDGLMRLSDFEAWIQRSGCAGPQDWLQRIVRATELRSGPKGQAVIDGESLPIRKPRGRPPKAGKYLQNEADAIACAHYDETGTTLAKPAIANRLAKQTGLEVATVSKRFRHDNVQIAVKRHKDKKGKI